LMRTGVADLGLHRGRAPSWLIERMKRLAKAIVTLLVDEYGTESFLARIADPMWFQAISAVLGYDFDSSGVTSVTCGILKDVLDSKNVGLRAAGGKGKASRKVPMDLERDADALGLSSSKVEFLKYASRMAAKVDNAVIQCNYPLYHHTIFYSEEGSWAIVQQGMNTENRRARRYHWLSSSVCNFVVEPHTAIVCDQVHQHVLNMAAKESEECRMQSVQLVSDGTKQITKMMRSLRPLGQSSLYEWTDCIDERQQIARVQYLPEKMNWEALDRAYNFVPRNYEALISISGIGPATIRGLALISDIIYGKKPSWRDPARFSFAFGGKDGVPFPVDRRSYDKVIEILEEIVKNAELDQNEQLQAMRRLRRISTRAGTSNS